MSIPPLSDILVACDEVGWAWGKRSPGASEDMLFGISRGLATRAAAEATEFKSILV